MWKQKVCEVAIYCDVSCASYTKKKPRIMACYSIAFVFIRQSEVYPILSWQLNNMSVSVHVAP